MQFDMKIARQLAKVLTIKASVRTATIAKVHADGNGADLAFVGIELSFGGATLFKAEVTAKLRSGARIVNLPTYVGSDGKRRLRYFVSNEVRALIVREVFANEQIVALAERYEAKLASASTDTVDNADSEEELGL